MFPTIRESDQVEPTGSLGIGPIGTLESEDDLNDPLGGVVMAGASLSRPRIT